MNTKLNLALDSVPGVTPLVCSATETCRGMSMFVFKLMARFLMFRSGERSCLFSNKLYSSKKRSAVQGENFARQLWLIPWIIST